MSEQVISSRNREKLRMNAKTLALILVALVALARQAAVAEVKPAPLCGEGMVLQQEMDARLWGTADPGEEVTVTFRGKKATAIAKEDGRWLVSIPSGAAGGPLTPSPTRTCSSARSGSVPASRTWTGG